MELTLFFLLALAAIVSAAGMIYAKNAVHSALFLILNFGCVALLFLMLDAPFISMVQIAVYAGAIMVLFLFVIMLLGAEDTTDTEARQFGWLTQVATVLGASFLFAMATPLLLGGGLGLPEAPGEAPRLRLIHTANVAEPVNITMGDITVAEAVRTGEMTGFDEFESGEYDVVVTNDEGEILFETPLTLEPDQILSVVAYGEDGIESVATIPSDLDSSSDNSARINVLNLVTEDPLYLVNLGRDRQLDISESGDITDTVLTETLVFGEVTTVTLADSRYNLRFVVETSDGYEILATVGSVNGWNVEEATEQTFIFTPDYASTADQFGYRATVITDELEISEPFGSPGDIGGLLFIDYLLPVNLVGFLLLVALVGVIVLTRPELTTSRRSTLNRRRKVSRPLVSVITEQTGRDVVVETPKLDEPGTGD